MKKRIFSFILILCILLNTMSAFAATDWPEPRTDGRSMPIRPADAYVSMQNPPSFTWNYVAGAKSYELAVFSDKDCTKKAYSKAGIPLNYYNFDHTFEAGKTYWWKVRYVSSDGSVSEWTDVRRFRIDPDATEFTVPDISILKSRIPSGHPRIIATGDTLEEFRNLKNTNFNSKKYYDYLINKTDTYYTNYKNGQLEIKEPQKPDTDDPDVLYNFNRSITSHYTKVVNYAYESGYAYLLSGDERYAELCLATLNSISGWAFQKDKDGNFVLDSDGNKIYDSSAPSSYASHDIIHRVITYKSAMAYDWIYNTLSEEEKAPIEYMIRTRAKVIANHLLDDPNRAIHKSPFDSHGWSAIGFLGIVSLAMYDEIPEAEYWFENIVPSYAALLPPWSYQDGGWSQGTDYWKDSTIYAQEFMDVMTLGGILNYYNSAWASREYLWSLYAFPKGSYGAFGDDSNIRNPESASQDSVANTTYFTQNPVAKWVLESLGGGYTSAINTYYTDTSNVMSKPPENLPLSHEFNDIGWVVMTDNLMDPDRVQAYFKSSFYGSFNHSHADQNSFIIQAFGEKLAVKSGYYDDYHSAHDKAITRATFAHNSITIDGGNGQPSQTDDFTAKGDITDFVTHMSFDSATGDATPAYKGALDKYVRHFIYIRPGVFVVIDDLDAKDNTSSSFEWWLNAEDNTLTQYGDNSALIENGNANLKANVIYPKNTTVTYYDGFINPIDGLYYPANARRDYEDWPEHDRISFATTPVDKTKMVVTMSVYEDSHEQTEVKAHYANDGSYVKLDFSDGNTCVVNLGDSSKTVTCDEISFKGEAVTYSKGSIMLTQGTYLSKNGTVLIDSQRTVTLAMGHNQLSLSTLWDYDDYQYNKIEICNNSEYLSVESVGDITDDKARALSDEIGLPDTLVTDKKITLYPYKGSYILLMNGASVSKKDIKISDLRIENASKECFDVLWDESEIYDYDIIVNNTVYENVNSPYTIDVSSLEKTYSIAVRAKDKELLGEWSEYVSFSPDSSPWYSHVKYTKKDGLVTASLYGINAKADEEGFHMVVYDEEENVHEILPFELNGNKYSATADISQVENAVIKTFLWSDDHRIVPVSAKATFFGTDLSLSAILADGVKLKDFASGKSEYDIKIHGASETFPYIEAYAADEDSTISISHDYLNRKSVITVTSGDGNKKETVINYIFENGNLHHIKGACEESDFVNDNGRKVSDGSYLGKESSDAVVKFSYDIEHYAKYKDSSGNVIVPDKTVTTSFEKDLKVYTNVLPNRGGERFGSRTCSDREPNGMNHMEFVSVVKSLWGYDYIVMPNVNFYTLNDYYSSKDATLPENNTTYAGGKVKNAKLEFALEKNAEVVIVSAGELTSLEQDGFVKNSSTGVSGSRYMNTPKIEDVFYNDYILGLNAEDYLTGVKRDADGNITNYSYFYNYDLTKEWKNVVAISGYGTYKAYKDAYEAGTLTKDSFKTDKVATCENVIVKGGEYDFKNTYIKVYDSVDENGETVTLNLGSFDKAAPRTVVIVRPVAPKAPTESFQTENSYLNAIFANGIILEDFSSDRFEYDVTVPYGAHKFPEIKACAEDNTSGVVITHDYANLKSVITVTTAYGKKSEILINYILENEDIHAVMGALNESDFVNDSGRRDSDGNYSGKKSSRTLVKLSYDIEHYRKYKDASGMVIVPDETSISSFEKDLSLYTNVLPNRGGSNFGSRICSDRDPIATNHTEFVSPSKSLWGYDYIVMPNNGFYALSDSYSQSDATRPENNTTYAGGKVKNAKLEFTLAKESEIVVVSAGELKSLVRDGFSEESTAGISSARYMNLPGVEDVFYNDYILGKKAEDSLVGIVRDTEDDIIKFSYFMNYDLTDKWVNVVPIAGYTTYKAYRDAYDSGEIGKGSFVTDKIPTCKNVVVSGVNFDFVNIYTKVYDDVGTDGKTVTLDLGSFSGSAPRSVVIIRPVSPKGHITNFTYDGPVSFEDLPYEYRESFVDNAANNATLDNYEADSEFKVLANTLKEGARAYIEGGYTLTNINSQLGIEGAYYIPPHRRADILISSGANYVWMKAYYHSIKKLGNALYPNFPKEPQPWYSFDLNQSSMLYVITSGDRPAFLDETWQKLNNDEPAFTVLELNKDYGNVYVKRVDVGQEAPVRVSMKTYSAGDCNDGVYYLAIKPMEN